MALELYFTLSLLFFVSVSAVAEAEQYVEDSFLSKSKVIDGVLVFLKKKFSKIYRNDDEFYCFFKKDAFDIG
ncbi:hypothetical protein [Maridesulfovibrio sp.]|uniref:hypothetical protein n=1 Tax=unclassified Maridesulfovibrio TaxID=2794999 RepID=UPI003AFFFC2A